MRYNRKNDCIEMSVAELCALANRRGDLNVRRPRRQWLPEQPTPDTDAPAAGEPYRQNVTLRNRARLDTPHADAVTFSVSGRADGVLYDPAGMSRVELTRTAAGNLQARAQYPDPETLAQLCTLGYFLCAARELPQVTLRLTYVHAGGDASAESEQIMTAERLRAMYVAMLSQVLPRAADLRDRQGRVRDLLAGAAFPYPTMRGEQEDMIRECYRDIRRGQTLFAQAPTGIGKTVSTLYPAVRALGKGICDKIFYLTAKGAARREAYKAAEHLCAAGAPLRACVITARESVCLCEAARARRDADMTSCCDPAVCPYAKGYYDRAEGVIRRMLAAGNSLFTGRAIRAAAEAGHVCPYELSLDLSEYCELIICDYNYVFSPTARLRRYFGDGEPAGRYVFLVDEAHNLPDRVREMYSGGLSLAAVRGIRESFLRFEQEGREKYLFPDEDLPVRGEELTAAALEDVIGALSQMAALCAGTAVTGADGVRRGAALDRTCPGELIAAADALSRRCARWIRNNPEHPLGEPAAALFRMLRELLTAASYYDRGYVTYVEAVGEDVTVRLVCLDPAPILRPLLHRAVARVLFSATLTPTEYFADILGGGADSVQAMFGSPFPPENLCISVADQLSTRFGDRDKTCRAVVSYIAAAVSAKPGNYLVYLPSYEYLEKVSGLFRKRYPKVDTVVQTRHMSGAEREAFIASFRPDNRRLHIGFCVLGGSFSEGVDLPGKCLIGAVIVGVGMPGLSSMRNIMREYYDETREGEGYAYAYTYPGMNRVLQAAGRVIRTPEDRGAVVLLDDRYTAAPYRQLFPPHWADLCAVGDPLSLAERLRRFWGKTAVAPGGDRDAPGDS